ncbi:GNAT family N-acetyltransferase [Singulisphaera acidiphila]|uniref:Acetyltransferase n=1 Tax=Singulisphaera acidiphila (strain ATCC BAA-1392 / DSM 18658 / VKM B-2454 / MOB10) TaxID=886293 RepID=L0DQK8_SINAD|nr:GNAT family N-acetyltransferase [Singulisphaera acidiphila]AGA31210.1 acetyltransferase [Singulisphaera acidiphila DSM 18658]
MANWKIERLDRSHNRASFSCGKPPLDEFIRRLVSQYEKRNLGRTYVAVQPGEKRISGYYTLASSSIAFRNLPEAMARKIPKHPVPVILIARLAVDQHTQGQRLGETLLADALERCLGLADEIGIHAVEVDAIDQQARGFYEKYGFVPLPDRALHLFLPVATIRDSIKPDA